MSDELLPYFNRELEALRHLAAQYVAANPRADGQPQVTPSDPQFLRLLEGIAFLTGRVHHRLDDEFPELTDALLGVLYPHYMAPIPAAAIVEVQPQSNATQSFRLEPGAVIDSEPVHGETCRFRTAWPLTLWPIEVESARLSGLPLAAPANPNAAGAVSVLRIVLKGAGRGVTFAGLGIDRLRFFLHGAAHLTLPLYELLCAHTVSIAYADGPNDPTPAIVSGRALEPVGFAPEDALLPWPARSSSGFRLLTEYFAFPQKFMFVDFTQIDRKALASIGNRLEIFVYLNRAVPELERAVNKAAFALGCTPVVNLFEQSCEPIPLSHADPEYRVVPDAQRAEAMEIWQLQHVRENRPDGSTRPWRRLYGPAADSGGTSAPAGFFHETRRDSAPPIGGSDVYLAPSDPNFDPDEPADRVLSVNALCFNRDLPAQLPFGRGRPELRLAEPAPGVAGLICLTEFTPVRRPPRREGRLWRLIAHLSLDRMPIVGGSKAAGALHDMLRLYDWRDDADTHAAIETLVSATAEPGIARAPGSRLGAFCRGLDVTLEFDAGAWDAAGVYLLASVLDRVLALNATVNSFVRTRAMVRGKPDRGGVWPPRAGSRILL